MSAAAGMAPGWPGGLPPPASPEFTAAAVSWLLDVAPGDYRGYPVLRRHPVLLAYFTVRHLEAAATAARGTLAGLRAEVAGALPPETVAAAVGAAEQEVARLAGAVRGARLVADALRTAPRRPG